VKSFSTPTCSSPRWCSPAAGAKRRWLFLADIGTIVKPRRRLVVLKDAADNRILKCALAGRAQAIVTGDKALLALMEYRGVRILSLADYLKSEFGL